MTNIGNISYTFKSKTVTVTTTWVTTDNRPDGSLPVTRNPNTTPPTLVFRSVKIAPPPGTPENVGPNDGTGTLPLFLGIENWENEYTIIKVEATDNKGVHNIGDSAIISVNGAKHTNQLDYNIPCDIPEGSTIPVIWYLTRLSNRVNVYIRTHTGTDQAHICSGSSCPGTLTTVATPTISFIQGETGEALTPSVIGQAMIYRGATTTIGWENLVVAHFRYLNYTLSPTPNAPTITGLSTILPSPSSSISDAFTPALSVNPWLGFSIQGDITLNFVRIPRNVTIVINSPCGNVNVSWSGLFSNESLTQSSVGDSVMLNNSLTSFDVDSGTCIDIGITPSFCCGITNASSSPGISNLSISNTSGLCITTNTTFTFTFAPKTFQVRVYYSVDNCCTGAGCPPNNSHIASGANSGNGTVATPYIVNCNGSLSINACASHCCEFDISGSNSSYTINHQNNGNDGQGNTNGDIPNFNISDFTQTASQICITLNNISDNVDIRFNYITRQFSVNVSAGPNGSFSISGANGITPQGNRSCSNPSPTLTSGTAHTICGDILTITACPDDCYVLDTATPNGGGLITTPTTANQLTYQVNTTTNAMRNDIQHPPCPNGCVEQEYIVTVSVDRCSYEGVTDSCATVDVNITNIGQGINIQETILPSVGYKQYTNLPSGTVISVNGSFRNATPPPGMGSCGCNAHTNRRVVVNGVVQGDAVSGNSFSATTNIANQNLIISILTF